MLIKTLDVLTNVDQIVVTELDVSTEMDTNLKQIIGANKHSDYDEVLIDAVPPERAHAIFDYVTERAFRTKSEVYDFSSFSDAEFVEPSYLLAFTEEANILLFKAYSRDMKEYMEYKLSKRYGSQNVFRYIFTSVPEESTNEVTRFMESSKKIEQLDDRGLDEATTIQEDMVACLEKVGIEKLTTLFYKENVYRKEGLLVY